MTRLEAIRWVRGGQTLSKVFTSEADLVSQTLEVWVRHTVICDYVRHKQPAHENIGPLHVRFWSGAMPHWIHISPKQLLSFIKRNFPRCSPLVSGSTTSFKTR